MFSKKEITRFHVAKEATGVINPTDNIAMGDSCVSSLLISRHFSPCIAVLAVLDNDTYALFHANVPYYSGDMKKFIELIQGQAKEVIVFQKNIPARSAEKCPILTMELAIHLEIDVNILCLEKYTGIMADASKKKITLFDKDHLCATNNAKTKCQFKDTYSLSEKKLIHFSQTFKELCKKYPHIINDDGSCALTLPSKTVNIPAQLVPESFKTELTTPEEQQYLKMK